MSNVSRLEVPLEPLFSRITARTNSRRSRCPCHPYRAGPTCTSGTSRNACSFLSRSSIKYFCKAAMADVNPADAGKGSVSVGGCFLRLATPADVPHIVALIRGLAEYEKLLDECHATDDKIHHSLFGRNFAPFEGPTTFLVEVSADEAAPPDAPQEELAEDWQPLRAKAGETGTGGSTSGGGGPCVSIADSEADKFKSALHPSRTVAAFVLVYPTFSTFVAGPNLYVEDLFVRPPYRALGLGTRLLRRVCREAVQRGMPRVDWQVLPWNQPAIGFYTQRMGAKVMGWLPVRLEGDALRGAAGGGETVEEAGSAGGKDAGEVQ